MRILLLSNMYPTQERPYGGTFVSRRIEALQDRGHEVLPVGVRTRGAGVMAATARLRGRPGASPAPTPPYGDYLLPVGLRRRLRRGLETSALEETHALADLVTREGIDLVHGHGMYVFPAGSIARDVADLAGVPYIVTVHGQDIHTCMRGRVPHYREVLDGAAAVICVSEELASTVSALVAPGSVVSVVPNGYDPDAFFLDREQLPRKSSVLFVGNLERVKGADLLPELWWSLQELRPGIELDVVGSGSLGPRLRRQLAGAVLHGQVSPVEVGDRMRGADVLVLPSRSEGFPTVIAEAYACGLPVVGFDVGGMAEAIAPQGDVVPVSAGVAGLARAAVGVLDDRRHRADVALLARGRTWAGVAGQEERVYVDALSTPRTTPRASAGP